MFDVLLELWTVAILPVYHGYLKTERSAASMVLAQASMVVGKVVPVRNGAAVFILRTHKSSGPLFFFLEG